jgi:type II secretory pathway pseudopilin PulG
MTNAPPPAANGFALAETLVAAAIIAIMTGVAFQSIASNAQSMRMIDARRQGLAVAQSALALAEARSPLMSGETSGAEGGYRWIVTTSTYNDNARSDGPPLMLLTVDVTGTADRRPLVHLETLRLAR